MQLAFGPGLNTDGWTRVGFVLCACRADNKYSLQPLRHRQSQN